MGGDAGSSALQRLCSLSALQKLELQTQLLAEICATPAVDWVTLIGSLLGGLSLFLHGMEKMNGLLRQVAGPRMKTMLQSATSNQLLGAIAGFLATVVLSSSSAASVLVVSFVEAGLMPFQNTIGMILGINVGTTLTMHLTTCSIMKYAVHFMALGYFGEMLSRGEARKAYFGILNGLGLLFFSMEIMGGAMAPLKHSDGFRDLMKSSDGLPGVAISTIFTVVIQSSSAATAVISQLAQQQLLSVRAGISLVLGANVGTCGTACLAALGKKVDTQRVAAVYLFFKVVGVAVALPLLEVFQRYIAEFALASGILRKKQLAATAACPGMEECNGMAVARLLAWSHTFFNLALVICFLPFSSRVAALAKSLVSEKVEVSNKKL